MAKKASSKYKKSVKVNDTGRKTGVERDLIENFIGLQRVMVNLSAKFDSLSSQISRLLDLFEVSAKTLAKKEFSSSGDLEAKKIMEKLENLSQQAGLIGKGLALIHEVRNENERPMPIVNQQRNRVQPVSAFPVPSRSNTSVMEAPQEKMSREFGEFEKSIVSKEEKLGESTNAGTNA